MAPANWVEVEITSGDPKTWAVMLPDPETVGEGQGLETARAEKGVTTASPHAAMVTQNEAKSNES